ncbi:unnamed protein product [Rotaria magnacalcarata]|uniref:Reverse transcriptase domain-containing protein n=1 Tax=Rotaria magnacalcarata TaxID=392030 RepID=A0A815APT6_9BILA|nr:unnamed protein product [Rotaria magnacalcarata]CAF4076106.1 unnamed protein product [Rotaria magnacalcarata]
MLLNVSSLSLYLADIFLLLDNISCPIVVLNGTHHTEAAAKSFSKHFNNYNIYSQEGTNSFGGVLIAVHRSIPVQQVDVFKKVPNIIALDIGRSHDKFQLATCYSPPNEKLPIALFNQIMKRNKNTILLGDLNAKHQSWSRSNENQKGHVLFDWLLTKSMTVVNKHVATSTRSNATIDLILAPAQMTGIKTSFSVLPSMGSDHLPVIWIPDIKLVKNDCQYPIKRTYWQLFEMFLTFTFSYWKDLSTTMKDSVQFFHTYERYLSLVAARLTYVTYCTSYRPTLPPHIVQLIMEKSECLRLARKTKHPIFITQLKTYSTTIKRELIAYRRLTWIEYCKTFNKCDVKQLWKKTQRHFSTTSSPIQGFLMPNGNVVSSTSEMCDVAKSFYQEQFSEHKSTSSTIEIEAENVDSILRIHMNDNIPTAFPIEIKDIRRTIASLKNKNSTGIDGVSNKIIKLLPPSHQSIICTSFKSFASQLIFPLHWKVAKMILLPKTKSNIVKVEETRPISLLPCFSKLYEKIFLVQFRKWVNDAGILPEEQTGFRPGHNMTVRLVSIIDQIGQCLALNTAAAALFVDFKAAFNQLWYQGLWLKLHKMDCPTYLVGWLRSYLSGRSAYIDMKEARSSAFNLYKGVPQGSCVGPVIFIVYHHDLLNCMSLLHWKHLFADDLSVIIAPSATWPTKTLIPNLLERLKVVIASLITYTTMWKQPINFEKTQWTLFHRQVVPKIPLVTYDGYEIAHTSKAKLCRNKDTKKSGYI